MARLQFDQEGEAFFDLILSKHDEGFGAIAHLRVPKGAGRSSFVLHKEFAWGNDPGECQRFIAHMDPGQGGQGTAFLRNDTAHFSFQRRSDGMILFEARCFTDCGEVAFRAEVAQDDAQRFYHKLEEVCRKLARNGEKQ